MLISVIVPIYNIENYVSKCLDSIINQTYRDLEIILVDDGSTDSSGQICDRYANLDSRIKVIHQENSGLSLARNIGIAASSGELIAYIDGDDYIHPQYLEILSGIMIAANAEIAVCGTNIVNEIQSSNDFDNFNNYYDLKEVNYEELSTIDALEHLLYMKIPISCWAKLFRRQIALAEEFPPHELFEDYYTVYRFFSVSSKIAHTKLPLYCYLTRLGSITKKRRYTHNTFDTIKHGLQVVDDVEKNHLHLTNAAVSRLVWASFFVIANMDDIAKNRDDYAFCKTYIKNNRFKVLTNKKTPATERILCLISFVSFRAIRWIYVVKRRF